MKDLIIKNLECFNDPEFKFNAAAHRYTYDGVQFESVTRFIQQFHKPFESDFWSKKKAEQSGVSQEEILSEWKKLNDYANEIGTATHQWIEDYYNKIWRDIPSNLDLIHRINKFNKVFAKQLHKLEPVSFEVRVFSKKWKIAGMIDALFLYKGSIYIIDYKTNKDFTDNDHPKGKYEKLLDPFDNFYKNHLNEYSIQISLYALILREWGFNVAGGYLIHIGPGDEEAKLIKCEDMTGILEEYLNRTLIS